MEFPTIVRKYRNNYAVVCRGHYLAAVAQKKTNRGIGLASLILATVVGTTIFASIAGTLPTWATILAGLGALASAILSSLQTFMRFSELANEHKSAGSKYADMRRRLEGMLVEWDETPSDQRNDFSKKLEPMLDQLRELAQMMPEIPEKHYKQAEEEWKADNPTEDTSIPPTGEQPKG